MIPGKPVIGLEIPNNTREMIGLKEILSSDAFTKAKSTLSMGLGKDINGQPVVVDLAKMPHLLVAGATGMGKSVGLNAIILSILYKASPEQVRLIMIDPKIVELASYADIPHLLTPVVTNMNEALVRFGGLLMKWKDAIAFWQSLASEILNPSMKNKVEPKNLVSPFWTLHLIQKQPKKARCILSLKRFHLLL